MNITIKVAAIIVNDRQQKLLIKEQYIKQDGFKWNLVKGTYDNVNETLEECVKREINEEVGLSDLGVISLKKVYYYGTSENPKILFVFSVRKVGDQIPTTQNNNQDENISEVKWFSEEEISKLTKQDCMAFYVYDSIKNSLKQDVVVSRI